MLLFNQAATNMVDRDRAMAKDYFFYHKASVILIIKSQSNYNIIS